MPWFRILAASVCDGRFTKVADKLQPTLRHCDNASAAPAMTSSRLKAQVVDGQRPGPVWRVVLFLRAWRDCSDLWFLRVPSRPRRPNRGPSPPPI